MIPSRHIARTLSWGIAITARATYLKPWYEGFASAQAAPWQTLLVCPKEAPHDHAAELTTPVHPNLILQEVGGSKRTRQAGGDRNATHYTEQYTWMPDRDVARALKAGNTRGLIVHEYSPFALTALFYGRRRKLPIVSFTDVGQGNAERYPLKTRLWHSFWNLGVDGIMAGCPASRIPVSGRSLPYVESYHAVDSAIFTPLPNKQYTNALVTFVYSGQWIQRKGLDLWFAAARRMLDLGCKNFRLRLLGSGDEAWLREIAKRLGLLDHIEWIGYQQGVAMRQALGLGDVFVLPSRWDSYAVVAHEAACLGLPLLISKNAGAAEAMIEDGVTGWAIDPEDTEAFAQRMIELMNGETRKRLGQAARLRAEHLCARRRGQAVWEWITRTFDLPRQ